MATNDISTSFVKQFSSNVEMLVQQKGSVLRPFARIESVTGEDAYFDRIGTSAAVIRTTRHNDTPIMDIEHTRRKLSLVDYEWGTIVDKQDKLKMLLDPTSDYNMSAAFAMGRSMDDVWIAAIGGTAATGKTGSGSQTLPSGQKIAHGSAGMTIDKIVEAKYILDSAEVDPQEQRIMVVTSAQIQDLLKTTEVKSADYNTVKALAQGAIDSFCGFKFVVCNRLTTDGTSRLCYATVKSALILGIGQDIKANIAVDPGKAFNTRVYLSMSIGAVRMQEEKVVEVACNE